MTSRPPAYLASFPGCQNEHRQLLLRRWAAGNRREQRAGRAIKFVIGNPDVVEPRVALGGTADIKRGAIIGNFGKIENRFRVSPQLEGVSKDLLPDRFQRDDCCVPDLMNGRIRGQRRWASQLRVRHLPEVHHHYDPADDVLRDAYRENE